MQSRCNNRKLGYQPCGVRLPGRSRSAEEGIQPGDGVAKSPDGVKVGAGAAIVIPNVHQQIAINRIVKERRPQIYDDVEIFRAGNGTRASAAERQGAEINVDRVGSDIVGESRIHAISAH